MQTQYRKEKLKVVLGIGGSLEAALIPYHIVFLLSHYLFDIQTAVTPSATRFVTIEALQGITKNKVYYDNFQFSDDNIPFHIKLSGSELLVVFPCTARLVSEFALGSVTCPVTRIFAFFDKRKVLLAPSIHPKMEPEIYKPHFNTLQKIGCQFVGSSMLTNFKDLNIYFSQHYSHLSVSPSSNFLNI